MFKLLALWVNNGCLTSLTTKDYAAKMKRHNKALEQLTAASEKFFEKETKRKDCIQALEEQKRNANKDFMQINDLFKQLE